MNTCHMASGISAHTLLSCRVDNNQVLPAIKSRITRKLFNDQISRKRAFAYVPVFRPRSGDPGFFSSLGLMITLFISHMPYVDRFFYISRQPPDPWTVTGSSNFTAACSHRREIVVSDLDEMVTTDRNTVMLSSSNCYKDAVIVVSAPQLTRLPFGQSRAHISHTHNEVLCSFRSPRSRLARPIHNPRRRGIL